MKRPTLKISVKAEKCDPNNIEIENLYKKGLLKTF